MKTITTSNNSVTEFVRCVENDDFEEYSTWVVSRDPMVYHDWVELFVGYSMDCMEEHLKKRKNNDDLVSWYIDKHVDKVIGLNKRILDRQSPNYEDYSDAYDLYSDMKVLSHDKLLTYWKNNCGGTDEAEMCLNVYTYAEEVSGFFEVLCGHLAMKWEFK